ncbi:PglL family O-oligosaccharyltransferase [Klebsiella aerogenes]|uniref:PglL family O-oligosaccharyltransferase n=1 Tax=Klebsiella aerogenes TaxID=548 RepID=UPI001F2B6275|nr:O-antigen ligase family protein [Klebsiella aerogenes]
MMCSRRSAFSHPGETVLLAGLTVYWLFFLHIGWYSHGGWGTDLPMNLLAWCFMSVFCGGFWCFWRGKLMLSGRTETVLLAGAALMTLPLLWSPSSAALDNALPRLCGVWAGLVFWLTLRQLRLSVRRQQWLLFCLMMAGGIETGVVLMELFGPSHLLPAVWLEMTEKYRRYSVGVFQQVNVTASFLAMGLGAALLLLGQKAAVLSAVRMERIRRIILMAGIVLLSAVLTQTYSRTGWLSGLLVTGGIYCLSRSRRFREEAHLQHLLWRLPLCGVVVGLLMMQMSVSQALALHEGSNHQRLLTLYQTLRYAWQHPFTGYGAGSYEGSYQAWLAGLPGGNPGKEMMAHPHNELLYQFSEGGIIALSGALLFYGLYIWRWIHLRTFWQAGVLLAMLPVLLHTQLEYPLYYSVPHWLALLMLFRLSDGENSPQQMWPGHRRWKTGFIKGSLVVLMVYGTLISFQSFRAGAVLNLFESSQLKAPERIAQLEVPWVLRQRYRQDLTQLRLIRFRTDPDWDSLRAYTRENALWLSVHAWPELYKNQIAVLKYLHEDEQAGIWLKRAKNTLPWQAELFEPEP